MQGQNIVSFARPLKLLHPFIPLGAEVQSEVPSVFHHRLPQQMELISATSSVEHESVIGMPTHLKNYTLAPIYM